MKFSKTPIVAASLFALLSGNAMAHSDEYLDTQQAPNGGQLRMAGVYHFELVVVRDGNEAKDNPVVVHVTDHAGAKIPTAGAKASVILLSGKTRATIDLAPDGDNKLKGTGKYASLPDMKAIVSVTLPGKAPEQARFTPLAKPAAMAQGSGVGNMDHMNHMK